MKLNTEQITEIKRFIRSRGFTHIEVEMEILDHVATAVEEKLVQTPDKPLQQAIQEVHSSFGVFGFSGIEEEKSKFFYSLARTEFKKQLKHYLGLNYLPFHIIGLTLLFTYLKFAVNWDEGFMILPLFIAVVFVIIIQIKGSRRTKPWKSKSLMLQIAALPFVGFSSIGLQLGYYTVNFASQHSQWLLFSVIIFLTWATVLGAFCVRNTYAWAFDWTYKRYLKYN